MNYSSLTSDNHNTGDHLKPTKPKLFPSKIEVLYWAARGKTAEETAIIFDLSIYTIKTYRN